MKTAHPLSRPPHFSGAALVYLLSPPLDGAVKFVIVSAVDLPYKLCETMVFACDDADGNNCNFSDLACVRVKSHSDALQELGYQIL